MTIRLLPPATINRIAAGEVIERPASVVKELTENAIDAQSSHIQIVIHNSGRNLVSITDNGSGMDQEELQLCIKRHATSKLPDDHNLLSINSLGFRGEALPSIGSVSRMRITSRKKGSNTAHSIAMEGDDRTSSPTPASLPEGTKIDIEDLFFTTPARLKFLKSERAETLYIQDIVRRLAIAHPHIGFTLKNEHKTLLHTIPQQGSLESQRYQRLTELLGKEFTDNTVPLSTTLENITISGYAALPTYHKANSTSQYLFVNNRPVKDKLLIGSIKAAYQDFLARNRYAAIVIFMEMPHEDIDVNVHPTKAEIRFREENRIRTLIISTIKKALAGGGHRAATTVSQQTLSAFKTAPSNLASNVHTFARPHSSQISQNFSQFLPDESQSSAYSPSSSSTLTELHQPSPPAFQSAQQKPHTLFSNTPLPHALKPSSSPTEKKRSPQENTISHSYPPLGLAQCQLHKNYIVAQTHDGLVIVDQHAAHERLVYEKMKKAMEKQQKIVTQRLLIPAIIELEEQEVENVMAKKDLLEKSGLMIEKFGDKAIVVNETPALLGECHCDALIRQLANDLAEYGEMLSLQEKFEHICGTIACHGAVRSGRMLNQDEMNSLLRQMEETPYSGQCNHGRPTYVELKLHDIEKLFGRK